MASSASLTLECPPGTCGISFAKERGDLKEPFPVTFLLLLRIVAADNWSDASQVTDAVRCYEVSSLRGFAHRCNVSTASLWILLP